MPELEATVKLSAGWRKCIQSKPEAEQGCNPGRWGTSPAQHPPGYVTALFAPVMFERAFIFSGWSKFAGWGAGSGS